MQMRQSSTLTRGMLTDTRLREIDRSLGEGGGWHNKTLKMLQLRSRQTARDTQREQEQSRQHSADGREMARLFSKQVALPTTFRDDLESAGFEQLKRK